MVATLYAARSHVLEGCTEVLGSHARSMAATLYVTRGHVPEGWAEVLGNHTEVMAATLYVACITQDHTLSDKAA